MRRNKIKDKYLTRIKSSDDNNVSNLSDTTTKKITKGLISLLWIFLLLLWSAIPSIVMTIMKINPDNLSNMTKFIISFINDLLFIILLVGVYYKTLKNDFKKYFNHNFKDNLKQAISYWLLGLGIMFVSNLVIAMVMSGELAENEEAVRSMIDMAPLYMVFQLVVYAPITEELIFRKSIREIFNNKYVFAIVSGIIFGGLHAISSITDVVSLLYLIPYCSLGIVFGLLYGKTNNIFSTMTAHAIHNFLALLLYLGTL